MGINPMEKTRVAIIGAGLGGLCAGIKLKEAGIEDFLIFERNPKVGGTWYENKYPGCCCDTPVALYEFSFFKSANWNYIYPHSAEVQIYAEELVEAYQLGIHLRLAEAATEATWDAEACQWHLITESGREILADAIIAALGQLNRPAFPSIEGLDRFEGPTMHSARWKDDVSLSDKRVGVVGSAASAVQLIPEVAKEAAALTVFQRSANYVIPKIDRAVTDEEKTLMTTAPDIAASLGLRQREMMYDHSEYFYWQTFSWTETGRAAFSRIALNNLEDHVPDPELRKKLTPDYPIGCKRVLVASDFYPAMMRENVSLVTDGIARIHPQGLETNEGAIHPLDVLVFATGFETSGWHWSLDVIGSQGQRLQELWSDGPEAYQGITVAGFPNFFMLYGPNTNLGHGCITNMLELEVGYTLQALQSLEGQGAKALSPTLAAQTRFNQQLQEDLSQRVWADPQCTSWYKNAEGKITQNWSDNINTYAEGVSSLVLSDYEFIR